MGHLLSNIVRQEGIKTIEYPSPAGDASPVRDGIGLMKRENGSPGAWRATAARRRACEVHHDRRGGVARPDGRKYPVGSTSTCSGASSAACGVEACPCDAIRMDTGWFTPRTTPGRSSSSRSTRCWRSRGAMETVSFILFGAIAVCGRSWS